MLNTYALRCALGLVAVSLFISAGIGARCQTPPAAPIPIPTTLPPIVQERSGLPHVFAKLAESKPVTIVYFGGSITEGAGASKANLTSYRALVGQWFTSTYPNAAITNVNASIGGTGSDLGAFRCSNDVLSKKPDLVFVEFAVNDNARPIGARGMEGIVRQIRRADPTTDIAFVYTYVSGLQKYYESGSVTPGVAQEEPIAAYYDIPSVNAGQAGAEAIMRGDVPIASFFIKDGTHPSDFGHKIYADAVINFLQSQANLPVTPHAKPYSLPAPLRPDSLENGNIIPVTAVTPIGAGWALTQNPTGHFHTLLESSTPGSQQTFTFKGPLIGFYWIVEPASGMFSYQIDGGPAKTVDIWDKYAPMFSRSNYRILGDGLTDTSHTIMLTVLPDHNPGATGNTIPIGGVLVNAPQD